VGRYLCLERDGRKAGEKEFMATMDPDVRSWTPINMWAMLRALINNNCPLLTINGIQFPIVNGVNGTFVGQAGKGSLLIDFGNGLLYQNTGTISNVQWTLVLETGGGGGASNTAPYAPTPLTANGAINPSLTATYVITKNGAAALTLAAPIPGSIASGGNDGVNIIISSSTPFQHVITAIGLLQTGTAAVNYVMFPQFAGGEVDLMAYNGKWIVLNSQLTTFQ
jgi:hypothetical protein